MKSSLTGSEKTAATSQSPRVSHLCIYSRWTEHKQHREKLQAVHLSLVTASSSKRVSKKKKSLEKYDNSLTKDGKEMIQVNKTRVTIVLSKMEGRRY